MNLLEAAPTVEIFDIEVLLLIAFSIVVVEQI
jgi:hypothetical protein